MLLINYLDSICDALLRIFQSNFKLIMAGAYFFELRRGAWRNYLFLHDLADLADRKALKRFLREASRLQLILVD